MWMLKDNEKEPNRVIYLYCGKRLTISRKQGDILLTGDQSISRDHATLKVSHSQTNVSNCNKIPEVELFECGSKFGTYINDGITQNTKVPERSSVNLHHGDKIRFGILTSTWTLYYEKLIVTTTVLSEEEKQPLMDIILWLGGHLIKDWSSDCTHLVSTNLKLTPKAVCALSAAIPIVTLKYFEKLKANIISKVDSPNFKDYVPSLHEPGITRQSICLLPNIERRSILKDKIVVFCSSSSMRKLSPVVKLIGGTPATFSLSIASEITDDKYILIKPSKDILQSKDCPVQIKEALEKLKSVGKSAITESDIGLAVIYISTEKYCNPSFSMSSILKSSAFSNTQKATETLPVFATETQDMDAMPPPQPSTSQVKVIPESGKSTIQPSITPLGPSLPPSTATSSATNKDPNNAEDYNCYTETEILQIESTMASNEQVTAANKENIMNASRKRARKNSSEEGNANKKRSLRGNNDLPFKSVNDSTITTINNEKMDIEELDPKVFLPQHTSTQNEESENRKEKTTVAGTNTNDAAVSNEASLPCEDQTTVNPASFVPFTLPSIVLPSINADTVLGNNEDMTTSIKQEPETQDSVQSSLDWLQTMTDASKIKSKCTGNNSDKPAGDSIIKKEASSSSNLTENQNLKKRSRDSPSPPRVQSIKKERLSLVQEDDFALPVSNSRPRRRGRGADNTQKTSVSNTEVQSQTRTEVVNKVIPQTPSLPASTTSSTPDTIKAEPSSSKTTNSIPSEFITKSDKSNASAKPDPTKDDIAKLEESFTKIQFACLVVQSPVRQPERTCQTTNNNVKNFKRFKKNTKSNTSIVRIIGGSDLVAYNELDDTRRDDFFASHPESRRFIQEQEEEDADRNKVDDLFNLPSKTQRVRGRIR